MKGDGAKLVNWLFLTGINVLNSEQESHFSASDKGLVIFDTDCVCG